MKKWLTFYDNEFPFAGPRPGSADLGALQDTLTGAAELADKLREERPQALVMLHGPYFPKQAWPALLEHVKRGGGLVTIGGIPLRIPVLHTAEGWLPEAEQTSYHQTIGIHEALEVQTGLVTELKSSRAIPLLSGDEGLFSPAPTYGLALHVTRSHDHPAENGSGGPMDAHIYPLLTGLDKDGRERCAPVVLIENTKGDFAGGRWILANREAGAAFWEGGKGAEALARWAAFAVSGVTEWWLKPNYACFEIGEKPVLTFQRQRLNVQGDSEWSVRYEVRLEGGQGDRVVAEGGFELSSGALADYERVPLPFQAEPGYYSVEAELTGKQSGEIRRLSQGFWGRDEELLRRGEMITVNRDYFVKEGKPLPIVGMTYMTSDVARKYLHLPNASVWNRDMAQMAKAGINTIRTGLWTALRKMAFVDGHVSEEMLRAVDALFLTAKRHGLEVVFNFFAFTPELWEGENPYLDPRSVEAQKRFITSIVTRHKHSAHVHWDLINEPTMFDPNKLWNAASTLGDRFELAAYREWLQKRHGSIVKLQERWNMTEAELPSFDGIMPPTPGDIGFSTTELYEKRSGQWLDYLLFSQDMHNRWASELRAAIQAVQPKQLVTVGQDEGLQAQRPSPLFYEEAVDYTTVHSWWKNDQLVLDGIFAKTPYKPNVIQETGIMYIETPDGFAKRTEEELHSILERKYAYAFSTGGAGAVQWIWNINFYMHNINESHIGALRADGTEKPEADVSYDFGRFIREAGHLFEDRKLEEVAVVYPYSNDFSNRSLAEDITSRLTRSLAHRMNVPFRSLGEYDLHVLKDAAYEQPKLILMPSAHALSDEAFRDLTRWAETTGGTLLVTGPLNLDAYWHRSSRAEALTGPAVLANIRREEALELDGELLQIGFAGDAIAKLNKQTLLDEDGRPVQAASQLHEIAIGNGRLLWCPLPLELAESYIALEAVYDRALEAAGVSAELEWEQGGELAGVYGRKLDFAHGAVYIFVSEYALDAKIAIKDPVTGSRYSFTLEAERSVLFAADREGRIVSVYRPDQVEIQAQNG
ncbi:MULTISPECIES: beta-galactosidase [unclassified Paenibacillus]|uniref:beta-galactosidase n=1 Tax=Paenibacillus TaxID=44249 RepID=UPI0004121A7B|nr:MULTISPECIES: beta-galactosidase [unclassified Paenibacillus]KKC45950.1 glycoside hydrolase [Paenibacillus sp. D9]CDN44703.1 Glycoside hydrolase family 42 domain protein [Paenibacillus sp. P22]